MNIKKVCLIFITSLLTSYFVFSQSEAKQIQHDFGLHAGLINGGGFSYRFTFNKIGFQTTGFVFNTRQQELIKSFGGSLFYVYQQKKNYNLFVFLGGFMGSADRRSETVINLPLDERYKAITSVGWGIGFKRRIGDNFNFIIQVGPNYMEFRQKDRIFLSLGTGFYYSI
jgi:hypothetical protein